MEMAATDQGDSQHRERPNCPICLGKFKTPRQLPCLHTFCQGCLENYISSKAVKVKELKQFECPTCRAVVPVSRKGNASHLWASLFPINTILQSIGDKDKEEVDRHCDCCVSDGVSVAANGFCVVCEEAMCENCLNVHKKQKISKDHSIITIQELTNNPKNLIRYHKGFRCQEHEEENLKFYCRDHKIACCASCCIINHRNCDQVLDLKKDANRLLLAVEPLKVLEEMKKLEDHLMNFEKRNDSCIISLESQVQEMTNKIKEIRKNLNDLLDDLEHKVKSEGDQLYKQETIRKQEENHECQALLNAVRNSRVTLEAVVKHGSDTQIFIISDRMISHVKLCYEQIKEKFEELGTVTLSLEIDPQIQCIMTQGFDIGRVICRNEGERFPISRVKKPLKECQIDVEDTVKIKGPDDCTPRFTGVTYLQGDQVMLADFKNKKVILLNSSYQYIASFTLTDSPWDICAVDNQEVAVTLPHQKTVQFLCITTGAIKPTMTVKSIYQCGGAASAGNGKIAVSSGCYGNGKGYWSLIERTGKEMCYPFDCKCKPSPSYIAVNSSCNLVYLTVLDASSLYCFDMDGRMIYKYSPDTLQGAVGVATDRDDNVYVVGQMSKNIHQLTSNGTPIRIITEGINCGSMAICFNSSHDKILITTASDYINVFRLK